ncbi:MAG: Hsp70 family protein [Pseudomonadota bacterium]
MAELAIDFGTSNSAAGCRLDGAPVILEPELGAQTLPTAVFFDFEEREVVFGTQAEQALFDGAWGRYMRALKSLLGTPLIRESGNFLGKRTSYLEIVARFLSEMKTRAEAQTGLVFTQALSGRPVRFHADPGRDAQAETDLRDAYAIAGFDQVRFMFEPEAAARARQSRLKAGDTGLVIDIGGGTSDFTVFRSGGAGIEIVHSEGLRLGGTDFDRLLSIMHIMPLAGRGSEIRHAFGSETHLAPNAIFNDLATWQKIPFLYTAETRRAAKDLHAYAAQPDRLARLVRILEDERGHDLAFAVEAAKIALNTSDASTTKVNLSALEPKLKGSLSAEALGRTLAASADDIADHADLCTRNAKLSKDEITHLVLVGGSSLMGVVQTAVQSRFPNAKTETGGALTGIIEGLALSSRI